MDKTISNNGSAIDTQPYIAGFWRRTLALFIDSILIGLLCYMISLCFKPLLTSHPILFTFIGFILVTLYFGICNSNLNHGQTFGKKLLKIKVVDTKEQYISFFTSLIRATLTYAPVCLMTIAVYIESQIISILVNFVLSTIYLTTVYLFIFNRNNRRTIHDLVAKTIVINENIAASEIKPIWKFHFVFLSLLLILITSYFFIQTKVYSTTEDATLVQLKKLQPNILTTQVTSQEITENDQTFIMAIYSVQVDDLKLLYNSDFAKKLSENLYQLSPKTLDENNLIFLSVQAGYQFGFASKNDITMYRIEKTEDGVQAIEQVSTLNQF